MAMTLQERENFRQKMLDEYGPGWESILQDYGGMVNPQVGPAGQMTEPGMSFDPTRFRSDNPLSLLSSREDIELSLREPTKQDYINELDRMDPDRLQSPVRPPMEMNTSGVPYWDDPETAGSKIPFPYQGNNELSGQINALYDQGQSNYYGPSGFQNEISPLPHQLEGPETATGPSYYGYEGMKYDPNQELYDPNYYGTSGQMGQMGAPPPGIIPSSVTGRHTSLDAPYSVSGMSAMSGGEMPGLLDSGEGLSESEIYYNNLEKLEGPLDPTPTAPLAGPLAETGEGGKWEPEGDSIYRRKRKKDTLDDYLAKYLMNLGPQISGESSKWRSR